MAKAQNNFNYTNNVWEAGAASGSVYKNVFSYDRNGNILTQEKYDQSSVAIDNMTYLYKRNANNRLISNRLYNINDPVAYAAADIDDYSNPNNPTDVSNGQFDYDNIGNLQKDQNQEIENIEWTVYGK